MRSAAILLWMGLVAAPAFAGTEIWIETRRAGAAPDAKPQQSVIEVEGQALRAETGDGRHGALWNARAGVLQILDHREHSVVRIDRATARDIETAREGLKARIEQLPESQRDALERLLGTGAKPTLALRATGDSAEVSGVRCRLLDALSDGARVAEVCEAPRGALGIGGETLAPARALASFLADMGDLLPPALASEGLGVLALVDRIEGVPLRVRAYPKGAVATESRIVRAVAKSFAPERFEAPADYRPGLDVHVRE